ncbi:MAG: cation diffusion facilitator family transporter [Gammaproteobacteria bacterium]|nr:cation diffusion facilitator family transporter [Gammaproteobacteria bacterium]
MRTNDNEAPLNRSNEYRETIRVTVVGAVLDLLLGIVKVSIGFIGHSQALIADGVHSISDLASDALILAAARQAHAGPDEEHPYGHARIQTAATVLLAVSLALVAIGIAWNSISYLWSAEAPPHSGYLALLAAAGSAVIKEGMYHYTVRSARRLQSNLLKANAWHHRSDAFSSLVVIAGVGGSIAGFPWADPLAAVVVAAMIIRVAWKIGREGYDELIDTGVSSNLAKRIGEEIRLVDGVAEMHQLRTRKMGSKIFADVHIRVSPRISVSEGHRISDAVEARLGEQFANLHDVIVHIDPEDDDDGQPSINLPLRPVIERSISAALDNLRDTESAAPIRPENIVLHYLEGRLGIEIWLPLDDTGSRSAGDVERAIHHELSQTVDAVEVRVGYVVPEH